jgi:RHS repeat-associated protein
VSSSYAYNRLHDRISASSTETGHQVQANATVPYVPNILNQYASVGGTQASYDANGNLASDGVRSYAYDAENKLVTATTSQSLAFAYDPFGRRRSKAVGAASTQYLHDGYQVVAEYDASGALRRRFVYGPGVDEPLVMMAGAATYYYHADGIGSVIALSNQSGAKVESIGYDPFGNANSASIVGNPYLFTGRTYDAETGLYYYRARYYDPRLGRFLSPDPIGHRGGVNLYAYVVNNPVNLVDPTGWAATGPSDAVYLNFYGHMSITT